MAERRDVRFSSDLSDMQVPQVVVVFGALIKARIQKYVLQIWTQYLIYFNNKSFVKKHKTADIRENEHFKTYVNWNYLITSTQGTINVFKFIFFNEVKSSIVDVFLSD